MRNVINILYNFTNLHLILCQNVHAFYILIVFMPALKVGGLCFSSAAEIEPSAPQLFSVNFGVCFLRNAFQQLLFIIVNLWVSTMV